MLLIGDPKQPTTVRTILALNAKGILHGDQSGEVAFISQRQ